MYNFKKSKKKTFQNVLEFWTCTLKLHVSCDCNSIHSIYQLKYEKTKSNLNPLLHLKQYLLKVFVNL